MEMSYDKGDQTPLKEDRHPTLGYTYFGGNPLNIPCIPCIISLPLLMYLGLWSLTPEPDASGEDVSVDSVENGDEADDESIGNMMEDLSLRSEKTQRSSTFFLVTA
jgi:hypothetical protein